MIILTVLIIVLVIIFIPKVLIGTIVLILAFFFIPWETINPEKYHLQKRERKTKRNR